MTIDTVLSSIDHRGVATVTLNRPDKHNAFDEQMIAQLHQAFSQLDTDPKVRVVILAGAGNSFCAGADIGWMKRSAQYSHSDNLGDARALSAMLQSLNNLSKPTIARVQGPTFGGAVGLISCCDMAVASQQAVFALSETKIGLVPATIAPYVIAAIGQRAARRYFLTAERFTASQAEALGLLSQSVNGEQLDQHINALTTALLDNSPAATRTAKQLIFDVSYRPIDDQLLEQGCQLIADIRRSPEGQEGLAAFLEKRPAAWQIIPPDNRHV